ncbi:MULTISPECIES: EAL and HDOD domain-containing protein [Bacillus]|uniref:EAL and HDOD domain-containing protein n=1 Tax=Bacillus TaxID=1386 RepID=UPI000C77AA60|nr:MULTISPECIES: EAL domain-containing protein [Bacillus]PLR83421.1 hypothetical protein CVD23_14590 [Bacillus sp. V33-4]RSK51781.1 EAL domain-containing protein [Bacillus canaveralius]
MEVFVARQPIFNKKEEVFAYELLHRSNQVNVFPNVNGDQATADVIINSFLNIGIDDVANGKPCFINFTENLLQLRLPTYFRPREIVVEILESVEPSEEIIEICQELKALGYKIALDDYALNEQNPYSSELLSYADIIKVDFLQTSSEIRERIESAAKSQNIQLLAEKVETKTEFLTAKEKGYDFFQGYFFSKPDIVSTYDIPTYFPSYFEMIQNFSMTAPSIDEVSELIERDLSLSYKLLKLINSPAFRPKYKINSIRQAIILLGLIETQKWIYVMAVRETTGMAKSLSKETIKICLTRAKMCESVARLKKQTAFCSSFFMTGMFSLMDTVMGTSMEKILKDLPLQDEICEALKGEPNCYKEVLDLVVAVEKADWIKINQKCREFKIEEKDLFLIYAEALNWSDHLLNDEASNQNKLI